MSQLDNYLNDHREDLDLHEVPDGLWNAIEAQLPEEKKKKTAWNIWGNRVAAAILFMLLGGAISMMLLPETEGVFAERNDSDRWLELAEGDYEIPIVTMENKDDFRAFRGNAFKTYQSGADGAAAQQDANGRSANRRNYTSADNINYLDGNYESVHDQHWTGTSDSSSPSMLASKATGGKKPYTYQWAAGTTQGTFQNISGGTYTVVVGDANGCVTSGNAAPGSFGYAAGGMLAFASADATNTAQQYRPIEENAFKNSLLDPVSTFSIDVDAASYSNMRKYVNSGSLPPPDAVRLEELINYFDYDYPQPTTGHPFSINTEVAACPWNPEHRLVLIGLQGKEIATEQLPASNLTFLLDVSGSMNEADKLPLLKESFELLVNELRCEDRVSIVVYAGAAGVVLEPTPGDQKAVIMDALNHLQAGGSTAGGEGIELAYSLAERSFDPKGNNRVILATDGDFNVGTTGDAELVALIEKKRKKGIYLSVLGFGTGNYQDGKMEQLADNGNGNFSYIDNIREANKVFVQEMGGTLVTIAKDVKLQLEFNPGVVKSYRLLGYENRLLAREDFEDDTKDAGELGAGHEVTALYEVELLPNGERVDARGVPLKYQRTVTFDDAYGDELLTVSFRYKKPDSDKSTLIKHVLHNYQNGVASNNLLFAASVAEFGMILRNSRYKGKADLQQVLDLANKAKGPDAFGYRQEFIDLVQTVKGLRADL